MKIRFQPLNKKIISLAIVCLLAGIFFSMSLKTYQMTSQSADPSTSKNNTLIEVIKTLEKETSDLETQVANMNKKLQQAIAVKGASAEDIAELQDSIEQLSFIAEQTPVTGPCLVITINDNVAGAEAAKEANPLTYNPENYIVHDTDLRYLLNDISYIADAIAINGQRLVNSSHIRCVGTTIMVNSTRMAPPYIISLIGPPELLEEALLSSTQYNYLKNNNIPIEIKKEESAVLPAYSGSINSEYATIDENALSNIQQSYKGE